MFIFYNTNNFAVRQANLHNFFTFCKVFILIHITIDFAPCKLYNKAMKNLRKLRKSKNLTMKELGKNINLAESTISLYENGQREPDHQTLRNIANYFNVTVDYLLGREESKPKPKGIKIPVLGTIPAGVPVEAIQEILDHEEITEDLARTGEFFALKVSGDSMSPQILENDIVIIKKQDTCENNDICAVIVNGYDATLKRIKKDTNGIMLVPYNRAYEPTYYSK